MYPFLLAVDMKCSVENCTRESKTHGMCGMHYIRHARHGHMENTRPAEWGTKGRHPLYGLWLGVCRQNKNKMDIRWLDFFAFAEDVKQYPEGVEQGTYPIFTRINQLEIIGPTNFKWIIREKTSELQEARKVNAAYMREYNTKNKDKQKSRQLQKQYNITLEEYNTLLKTQNHVCAICNNPETLMIKGKLCSLAVDHCHDTGKIRGLLCTKCNRGIGLLRHDIDLLQKAILYLNT